MLFSFFVFAGKAHAATYYVSPGGSDNNSGTNTSSPWGTFSHALGFLKAGDTLYLMDGVYYQVLHVDNLSGTASSYINIYSLNDGGAIIDGQFSDQPVYVANSSYINLKGFAARNSNGSVVKTYKSNHILFQRVTAHDSIGGYNGEGSVFLPYMSSYITFEDCAGWGQATKIMTTQSSDHITYRRCFGIWEKINNGNGWPVVGPEFYDTSYSIAENNVSMALNPGANGAMVASQNWTSSNHGDYDQFLGNVVMGKNLDYGAILTAYYADLANDVYKNNVIISPEYGFLLRASGNVSNNTVINANGFVEQQNNNNFTINVSANSNSFSTGGTAIDVGSGNFSSSNNNIYNFSTNYYGTSAGTNDTHNNPSYNTSTYGNGAYLLGPTSSVSGKGATILYQYQNGQLTNTPLWPWPMEDRIKKETGISVTYEANGGLWKTLDGVYSNLSSGSSGSSSSSSNSSESSSSSSTPTSTTGNTYYVSPNGNDSSSGSESAPFKTIQKAANMVNPGDAVIVENGTYTDNNNAGGDSATVYIIKSGTANAPITFQAQNKWGAILDGQNEHIDFGFVLGDNVAYVNMKDFQIQNYLYGAIAGGFGGFLPINNINIYRNLIHNIGNAGEGSNGGSGMEFGNYSNHITINSNVIHDCGASVDVNHDHGIYLANVENVNIINNIMYNFPGGWHIHMYHPTGSASNINIVGNTFAFNNPQRDGDIIIAEPISGILIEDNVFYKSNNAAVIEDYASGTASLSINNNLATVGTLFENTDSIPYSVSKNILSADPSLVNPSSYDFHLQSNSPAIAKGISWSGRTYDADGKSLPNTPDIGAYEYGSSSSTSNSSSSSTSTSSTPAATPAPTTAAAESAINTATYSLADALKLVAAWFVGNISADVNNDGTISIRDLGIIMSRW